MFFFPFHFSFLYSCFSDDIKVKLQKNPGNRAKTKTNGNKRNIIRKRSYFNDCNDKSNNVFCENKNTTKQKKNFNQGFSVAQESGNGREFGVDDEETTPAQDNEPDIKFAKERTIILGNIKVNVKCGHTTQLEYEYLEKNQRNNFNKSRMKRTTTTTTQSDDIPAKKPFQIQQRKNFKEFLKQKRNHYNICVLWNYVPEEITLKHNENSVSYKFVMTVDKKYHLGKQEMMNGKTEKPQKKLTEKYGLMLSNYFQILYSFFLCTS